MYNSTIAQYSSFQICHFYTILVSVAHLLCFFLFFFCIFTAIVRTLASASRMSCSGEPVAEDSDAEVIIHKLHSSPGTANGVMTFAALGEKPRSSAKQFDMVRVFCSVHPTQEISLSR